MFGIASSGIPLHSIVMPFPIVLSVLLPISALVALRAMWKGTTQRWTWAVPVASAAALTVSSCAAIESGEREEDRVERIPGDSAMHAHEEAAVRFLVLWGVLVLVSLTGLLPRTPGRAGRLLTSGGAVGLLPAGVQVRRSGGDRVYEYGVASVRATETGAEILDYRTGLARECAAIEPEFPRPLSVDYPTSRGVVS